MIVLRYFVVVLALIIASRSFSAEPTPIREAISGKSLKAIQAAMPAFSRYGLDIAHYRVTVDENETAVFVTFVGAEAPADPKSQVRGNPGKVPAFEVELRRNDFQLVRSNFVR